MAMKLYMFQVAPNPTKVRLYIAEKAALGVRLPVEQISVDIPGGETRTDAFLAMNPHGTVPVLEMADGRHLTESLAIIEYLEEQYPQPSLLGDSAEDRALARALERYVDAQVLMPIARAVHATRSPLGLPANPEVAADANARAQEGLAYLDGLLDDGRAYLGGARPSVADCTLAAALQFGRFGRFDYLDAGAAVAQWHARYSARAEIAGILVM